MVRNKQITGLGHVTAADLKHIIFPYQDVSIIKFETTVQPVMNLYYSNLYQVQRLISIRDEILPKLIFGAIGIGAAQS